MKKLFSILLVTLLSFSVSAENEVTSFMGIPVEGNKKTLTESILSKGFKLTKDNHIYGWYNSENVLVKILEGDKGVYGIEVIEVKGTKEVLSAITKYNSMVDWFKNLANYTEYEANTPIIFDNIETKSIKKFIEKEWFVAEFYQKTKSDIEKFNKPVMIYLTEINGYYHLIIRFVNIYNKPEDIEN